MNLMQGNNEIIPKIGKINPGDYSNFNRNFDFQNLISLTELIDILMEVRIIIMVEFSKFTLFKSQSFISNEFELLFVSMILKYIFPSSENPMMIVDCRLYINVFPWYKYVKY